MTIFWTLAAGLAGLAVLFVVAPLLHKRQTGDDADPLSADTEADQAQLNLALFKQQLTELDADLESGKLDQTVYEAARRDLERQLLHDLGDRDPMTAAAVGEPTRLAPTRLPSAGKTALAMALAIPIIALGLYALIGSPALVPEFERLAASGARPGQGAQQPDLEMLITRLEQRLEAEPDDAEGWVMLGRTYFAMGNQSGAEEALAKAYALTPEEPMVVLAYAEAIATNNDHQLEGRPAELISEALAIAPEDPTARWLSAMVAFQRGQFQSAATTWGHLLEAAEPGSDDAAELQQLIAEAESRAGLPPEVRSSATKASASETDSASTAAETGASAGTPADVSPEAHSGEQQTQAATADQTASSDGPSNQPPAAASAGLRVRVGIDPELAKRYPPDTTLFVFARAASGPPMPLAVQRTSVGQLPIEVRLDDSMAMMPAMQISNFPQLVVGARVSPSGQAMPRPGDLEGETGPISSTRQEPVDVLINRARR